MGGIRTSELTDAILVEASKEGHRLFRNNSGKFKDKRGMWVSFGVGPRGGGGADLIGWCSDGKFASVEIKNGKDKQSAQQKMWENWVIAGGGRAGVARTVEEAIKILGGANDGGNRAPPSTTDTGRW